MFSGVAFSRRATISASVGSANLAAIFNFSAHRIWAEILIVKEPFRELRCHYLVTCVYNNGIYIAHKSSNILSADWNCKFYSIKLSGIFCLYDSCSHSIWFAGIIFWHQCGKSVCLVRFFFYSLPPPPPLTITNQFSNGPFPKLWDWLPSRERSHATLHSRQGWCPWSQKGPPDGIVSDSDGRIDHFKSAALVTAPALSGALTVNMETRSKAHFCGFPENVNKNVWIFQIFVRLQN